MLAFFFSIITVETGKGTRLRKQNNKGAIEIL